MRPRGRRRFINRLADIATPSGATPNELSDGAAFISLTALRASLREGPP
ncbi:hypothetical protein OG598_00230 [Micromonospora sp. NBC_00330]|nr:hypothetical protein [Micromonospora sp. NBC_00330]